MMVAEIYNRKGFDILLTADKTLVRTNLQAFLLYTSRHSFQIDAIRDEIFCGHIADLNELVGMFYNEKNEKIVEMLPVRIDLYV
jgi:hypothetical protein